MGEAANLPLGEGAEPMELNAAFAESLHAGVMARVRGYRRAARRRRVLVVSAAAAIFIFGLAFSFLTWHHTPTRVSMADKSLQAPKAAESFKAVKPFQAGGLSGLNSPDGASMENKPSNPSSFAAAVPPQAVSREEGGAINVSVRYDGRFAAVLEWGSRQRHGGAGGSEGPYRVLKSLSPDFDSASFLEWVEVEGTSYRDDDPRPGAFFYRVERVVENSKPNVNSNLNEASRGAKPDAAPSLNLT